MLMCVLVTFAVSCKSQFVEIVSKVLGERELRRTERDDERQHTECDCWRHTKPTR